MDIVFRRQAIYTGLKPFLSNTELLLAIQFWEMEFSSKPAYAINVFIARCCKTPELKAKRSEMLRSVVNAMEMNASQLLPDPGSQLHLELSKQGERRQEKAIKLDSKTKIFVLLFTEFLADVDLINAIKIKQTIATKITQHNSKERRVAQMQDWLNGSVEDLDTNLYLEFLQKVMNIAYVEMCEIVGAVKADIYLSQAIKVITPYSQELGFNLHDLL